MPSNTITNTPSKDKTVHEKRLEIIEKLKKVSSFTGACQRIFWRQRYTLEIPFFHQQITEFLHDKKHKHKMVITYRGSGKTAKATEAVLYRIAHATPSQKEYIIYATSALEQIGEPWLADLVDMIESSEEFRKLYGVRITRRTKYVLEINHHICIRILGSGSKIRGLKYKGQRPTLLIADDILPNEAAWSPLVRSRIESWFFQAALPILDPIRGESWLFGTPMHCDDLLMKVKDNPYWKHLHYHITKDGRLDGQPTWEAQYTKAAIIALKKKFELMGQLSAFYSEYMTTPVSDETMDFVKGQYRYYDFDVLEPSLPDYNILLAYDPSGGKNEINDENAISVCGIDDMASHYWLEIWNQAKADPGLVCRTICEMAARWNVDAIGIESVAYQSTFAYWLDLEMKRRNMYIRIIELKRNKAKRSYIQSMKPLFEAGKMLFPDSRPPWFYNSDATAQSFTSQYNTYPKSKKDDILDSMSMILEMEKELGIIPSHRKNTGRTSTHVVVRDNRYLIGGKK